MGHQKNKYGSIIKRHLGCLGGGGGVFGVQWLGGAEIKQET